MSMIMRMFAALLFMLPIAAAMAQPVQLTEVQFQQQTAALVRSIENFNAFPPGPQPSPLQLANGRYFGSPQIMVGAWCITSQCLTVGLEGIAEFADFPTDTAYWSGRIIFASSGDVLEATVVGNGGTQQFVLPSAGFVQGGVFTGFYDPRGLRSVSFRLIQGVVNYSFDDVVVAIQAATMSAVPAQSLIGKATLSIMLLTVGLLAIGRQGVRV